MAEFFSPLATIRCRSSSIAQKAQSESIVPHAFISKLTVKECRVWDPEGNEYIDMLSAYS